MPRARRVVHVRLAPRERRSRGESPAKKHLPAACLDGSWASKGGNGGSRAVAPLHHTTLTLSRWHDALPARDRTRSRGDRR